MFIKYSWIFCACFMLSSFAHAASFSCEKAKTQTEHAICEHRAVNDADVKMATTYRIVSRLVAMGTRSQIRDEQFRWLELRDRCGASVDCLTQVYNLRQQKLEDHLNQVYQRAPF
ncbi:lysozyme inhibitor LprI family protein [Acinetobacter sp. YH12131]|uniref:lysozyme inhibitor LprI family protein n=1 Tax=Acinetobacter sp. YH12131 TaxID=2601115 RepID=UPI0015D33CFB|nr:lysozyme inhibitor LprI family protein [Acinetobacter sp. YH12131]